MTHTEAWSLAFALTVAIEVPLVVALTPGGLRGLPARAAFAFAAQLLTHPLVWFVFPEIPWGSRYAIFVLSELFAWLAESAFYALTSVAPSSLRAIGVSALANGASLALGFVVL